MKDNFEFRQTSGLGFGPPSKPHIPPIKRKWWQFWKKKYMVVDDWDTKKINQ
jgi:hypothetical protein